MKLNKPLEIILGHLWSSLGLHPQDHVLKRLGKICFAQPGMQAPRVSRHDPVTAHPLVCAVRGASADSGTASLGLCCYQHLGHITANHLLAFPASITLRRSRFNLFFHTGGRSSLIDNASHPRSLDVAKNGIFLGPCGFPPSSTNNKGRRPLKSRGIFLVLWLCR